MKIVQVLPELNEGGVERGVVELNRELVLRGIESCVISAGGKLQEQITSDGGMHIQYDVCSKNILTLPLRIIRLKKILKNLNPDIIHVRSRVPAWLVHFANKSLKIKVVSTVHGFNSVSFYSRIMTNADHVICVSNAIKEYIQKYYETPDEKITVIARGIDTEVFNPSNIDHEFIESFKKKWKLENSFVVSSVGRVTQLKDYETFIKAISFVKTRHPNVVGLIVGGVREDKKEYYETLKLLASNKGLKSNIIFTGSQNKIAEIYSLSDVVVSSSKKPESFGRAVAEAIALNTPVIATDHGGVKDIILEDENGFLFDIGDERQLSRYILKSSDLNFNGYNYISDNFNLENMVEKTLNVYKGLNSCE
jgi:glycosyltransferase involved in cell wall biosynthesis